MMLKVEGMAWLVPFAVQVVAESRYILHVDPCGFPFIIQRTGPFTKYLEHKCNVGGMFPNITIDRRFR